MSLNRFALLIQFHLLFLVCMQTTTHASPAMNRLRSLDLIKDTIPDVDTTIFLKVDTEASFPGGDQAWRNFLEQNLNPDVPTKKKAPEGTYSVLIQFVVGLNGKITDIEALTHHGYGMEEEVIRLLSKAPRWKPAMLDGNPVRAYRKQPVTFMVMADEKKKKKKND